ncbi:NAD(P)H-binding protein [Pasteurellaceae bacterium LIM206]|nr:NAD(P)H-binding protein [Pasteurellaceae bacterium LIM206]
MKIAVIGASGTMGIATVKELADRKHQVTAMARNVDRVPSAVNVKRLAVDIFSEDFRGKLQDFDAVISTFAPNFLTTENSAQVLTQGFEVMLNEAKQSQVPYFLLVGGCASLYLENGKQLISQFDPHSPYYAAADASRLYLNEKILPRRDVNWAFIAPPVMYAVNPVHYERSGQYQLGTNKVMYDKQGNPADISVADMACALADDVERKAHLFQHFTVAGK